MALPTSNIADFISGTLLHTGDMVARVTKSMRVTHFKSRQQTMKDISLSDIGMKGIDALEDTINAVFTTGTNLSVTLPGYNVSVINHEADTEAIYAVFRVSTTTHKEENVIPELFVQLIKNIQDGIAVIDSNNKMLYVNKAFCNIYDITKDPTDLRGVHIDDGIADRALKVKDPETFIKRAYELHTSKQPAYNDEIELLNGKIYSRDFIPFDMGEGRIGEVWRFREITELKRIQQQLDDQRSFYERILNSIPEDIAVHAADHSFLYLNPAAVKDDVLRKWMIGKHHEDYFRYRNLPVERAISRNERFETVKRERKAHEWEETIVNRQGEISHHYRCLYPLFKENGALDIVIVFGANITDRVNAERQLKKSRDTFASAFNFSGTGMALLTPDGQWKEVNSALCEITGYTKEELLKFTYKDITYAPDLAVDVIAIEKLIQNKVSSCTYEKRYISKANKIVWILLSVSLVRNEQDEPDFFVAQITDITRMKELQTELSRKNADLETTRTSLLNKVKQLDDLNHIIAHNLRGPAGNIKMLSDPQTHTFDELGTDVTMSMIYQSSVALIESLNTLMEMAQIKLNKDIPFDNCDFEELTGNVISQLHGAVFEKEAKVETHLDVKHVSYPKPYLESILYNLVSNAIKYSSPSRLPHVVISTYMQDNRTILSVKDNGLGLDMTRYGHKLFQLNQVFHPGHDSKGIGLFITKTQIESIGGSITIHSEPDKGSEFVVVL